MKSKSKTNLISQGAEATIENVRVLGKNVVKKTRVVKGYRHPSLDEKLRRERLSHEAKMLHHVKEIGLAAPLVFVVDKKEMAIYMEFIDAPRLKHVLQKSKQKGLRKKLCADFGAKVALLHSKNIIHGDLTTSNVLVKGEKTKNPELIFIDFGLAQISPKVEDKAVDLVNLKKTFSATHSDFAQGWDLIVKGYLENGGKEAVLKQLKEVESRIRYA